MAIVSKITVGFVVQNFDTETGKCVYQAFTCGDECDWEDEAGNPVDEEDYACTFEYMPYEMKQPKQLAEEGWEFGGLSVKKE
jgi:hypothetical protein